MNNLILEPTITAEWQALVREAEDANHHLLSEDLESYLVFLLTRFTAKPEIAQSVLALDFLHGLEQLGQKKLEQLRDVGDKSLLFAGLFPGQAERRRVRVGYFVEIGQSAYAVLATLYSQQRAELYASLEKGFVALMDVLQVIRELTNQSAGLTLLQAEELWSDTRSPHALAILRRNTQGWLMTAENSKH
jgi:hypothetical protein